MPKIKRGDTVELTKDINASMKRGNRYVVHEVLFAMEPFHISVTVPNNRVGFDFYVPLYLGEFVRVP